MAHTSYSYVRIGNKNIDKKQKDTPEIAFGVVMMTATKKEAEGLVVRDFSKCRKRTRQWVMRVVYESQNSGCPDLRDGKIR